MDLPLPKVALGVLSSVRCTGLSSVGIFLLLVGGGRVAVVDVI